MSNSEKRAYDFSAVLAVEAFFLILFFFLPLEPFFRGHGADSEWVRAYYAVVGLLCLATTVLRSLNHRWAFHTWVVSARFGPGSIARWRLSMR